MSTSYLLGIDQGTSQTTAVVVDETGKLVARRSVQVPARFPRPGWVEQDPWQILHSVRQAAGPLVATYPVCAAGLDNQGETFILWDAHTGEPLTPAIVWQDRRGQQVCDRLADRVDAAWLRRKTGLLLDSYFSAPKLCQVLTQDLPLRQAAHSGRVCFGTTDSWVVWHLTGGRIHVADASKASRTLLFDIERLEWSEELLDLFDIPRAILPQVIPSAGYVGEIDLGVSRAVPLYGLLADQQAALFGQACFTPGDAKCTFGTGSFLLMNVGQVPRLSARGLLATVAWCLASGTTYALDGGILVTGAAVQWLADTLKLLPDVSASAKLAEQAQDQQVTFVPALAGLGAPHWQPQVRGALFGLSRATTAADIARATLEGIACRVHEVVQVMEQDGTQTLTRLKVDGGPSANSYLMQQLADLIGRPVEVAAAREATAIGIAHLAGHAALGISLEELVACWKAEAVYHPRANEAERQAILERWARALAATQLFHKRPAI